MFQRMKMKRNRSRSEEIRADNETWSTRVVVKYALLQVPGAVLFVLVLILIQRWVSLPYWLFWGSIGLWFAKDVALFPFVWRSYDSGPEKTAHSMIGAKGVTKERLEPSGYIRIRGELWKAELASPAPRVERGEEVIVRGIRGLTLLVEARPEEKKTG